LKTSLKYGGRAEEFELEKLWADAVADLGKRQLPTDKRTLKDNAW